MTSPLRNEIYTDFVTAFAKRFYDVGNLLEVLEGDPSLINTTDGKGMTLFHYAANNNDMHLLDLLLTFVDDDKELVSYLNTQDNVGNTPASLAAKNHHITFVYRLVELGADLYLKGDSFPSAIERLESDDANDAESIFAYIYKNAAPEVRTAHLNLSLIIFDKGLAFVEEHVVDPAVESIAVLGDNNSVIPNDTAE